MKPMLSEFAILGRTPMFAEPLHVGRPGIPDRQAFLQRIENVLDSGQLTNGGPMVCEFEQTLQRRLGVRHVVAVCNGTMALQLMAVAGGLQGEVIVPSMTFIATAHALQWVGLTPVFADIDARTHTLDPDSVARCVSERTSAILGVHLWGNTCDVTALQKIARRHQLRLLFDASHAFGCSLNGVPVGRFGDAEAFSFHATKILHSIEGGAVVTDDDAIAHRCRLLRNFGITGLTQIESPGTNARMNELCAAAGLTSLEALDDVIVQNLSNLRLYQTILEAVPGLSLVAPVREVDSNGQYVVVEVNEQAFGLSRDQLLNILRAEGVFARSYFAPGCHHAPPYAGHPRHTPVPLPTTERLLQELIQLPTGSSIGQPEIRQIGALLDAVRRHAADLRHSLKARLPIYRHPMDPSQPDTPDHHRIPEAA
ncbi:MAG: DegT/DnrJ/EryC1/StrS family aminotransferase [Fuerstiella sp.]